VALALQGRGWVTRARGQGRGRAARLVDAGLGHPVLPLELMHPIVMGRTLLNFPNELLDTD